VKFPFFYLETNLQNAQIPSFWVSWPQIGQVYKGILEGLLPDHKLNKAWIFPVWLFPRIQELFFHIQFLH
jgi:hypothetical protein